MRRAATIAVAVLLLAGAAARAQQPQLVIQTGHFLVRRVAFSPDGKLLATGSADGTVQLWDVAAGEELRTLAAGTGYVDSIAFSQDGQRVATATLGEKKLRVWETATGKRLAEVPGYRLIALDVHGDRAATVDLQSASTVVLWEGERAGKRIETGTEPIVGLRFAPGGLLVVSGRDKTTVWSAETGKLARELPGETIGFSADGALVGTWAGRGELSIVRVADGTRVGGFMLPQPPDKLAIVGAEKAYTVRCERGGKGSATVVATWTGTRQESERRIKGCYGGSAAVAFSPDGRRMSWGPIYAQEVEDTATGKLAFSLLGEASGVTSAAFVGQGQELALLTSTFDGEVKLWRLAGQTQVTDLRAQLPPGEARLTVVGASDDRRYLVAADARGEGLQLWDLGERRMVRTLAASPYALPSVTFSSDGRYLAVGTLGEGGGQGARQDEVTIYALPGGEVAAHFAGRSSADFERGGARVAVSGLDKEVLFWDLGEKRELPHPPYMVGRTLFSPGGKLLVSRGGGNDLVLWDASGKQVRTLHHEYRPQVYVFSRDGRYLAAAGEQSDHSYAITLWEVTSGERKASFRAHTASVMSLSFSADGKLLASASMDRTVKLWEVPEGRERATLVSAGRGQWVVTTPEGRWDAGGARSRLLHWVVGNESIALEQLKDSYYDPGVLGKVAGVNAEPLRPVLALDKLKLFPEILAEDVRPDGTLALKLRNRGGGVGAVRVFVNGVECQDVAPGAGPTAEVASLTVRVAGCPQVRRGQANDIKVVASNAQSNAASRGFDLVYAAPGEKAAAPRKLYVIIAGSSTYASPDLHLQFAAKDAQDMAAAVRIAGTRYFGAGNVDLQVLAGGGDPSLPPPTRANLKSAFERVAKLATPEDVLFVFLAGHGVTVRAKTSEEKNGYFYLTSDASSERLQNVIAATSSVSSDDLAQWLRAVPALGRVVVLDTCEAGGLAAVFSGPPGQPSGSQIIAMEQLKDRQNLFVLMGAAADKASFESPFYKQGLLTYALLQGVKGAAVDAGGYVDAGSLLNYSVKAVPRLAARIGRSQQPYVSIPYAGELRLGQVTAEDARQIPLATVERPILRPNFTDTDEGWDKLELGKQVEQALAAMSSARGGEEAPPYMPADEFPGAVRPQGVYTVKDGVVAVRVALIQDKTPVARLEVTGAADKVPELVQEILQRILAEVEKLPQ